MSEGFPSGSARYRDLQRIIAAITDGVILIETDQTIIWANRTALAMHGVDTVAALGGTVSEYRRRFELRDRTLGRVADGRTPIERVMTGETFEEVVVDVAVAGEAEARWTHRIRSLVLTDEAGLPDLLVLILDDETERYDAEERFEASFNANPAPAVIVRLRDLRHVRANQGFLDMTGYDAAGLVGRSVYEVDILEGAARRELAIERLQAGRMIPQMEATLQLPDGGEKAVLVAGQPIEFGAMHCMLFTFADLSGLRQAEHDLRRSEERFALAFRMAPLPMALLGWKDWRFMLANEAFAALAGHTAESLVGRTMDEAALWDDKAARTMLDARLRQERRVAGWPFSLRTGYGGTIACLVSAERVEIGEKDCVLVMAQNDADRERSRQQVAVAIASVMQDTAWFTEAVLDRMARHPAQPNVADPVGLSRLPPRAREILAMICRGLDDAAIAASLDVSRNTVRNHVSALFRRTGVDSRARLVIWARERGA